MATTFNINNFKQNGLVYGGARPSLFSISLSPNTLGLEIGTIAAAKLSFLARAAEIPASDITSFDVPYFGRKIKLAGDRTFADWRITIMNDEDFLVRAMFERWSNAINRMVSNVRDLNAAQERYKTDVEVIQYAKTGELIRSYMLVGAFPTVIDAISLDWNSTNAIEEFSVTFSYDYWVPVIETSTAAPSGTQSYSAASATDGPNP